MSACPLARSLACSSLRGRLKKTYLPHGLGARCGWAGEAEEAGLTRRAVREQRRREEARQRRLRGGGAHARDGAAGRRRGRRSHERALRLSEARGHLGGDESELEHLLRRRKDCEVAWGRGSGRAGRGRG